MQNIISYNEMEVRKGGSKDDIRQGYNIWVDLTDPNTPELLNVQQSFHLMARLLKSMPTNQKDHMSEFLIIIRLRSSLT